MEPGNLHPLFKTISLHFCRHLASRHSESWLDIDKNNDDDMKAENSISEASPGNWFVSSVRHFEWTTKRKNKCSAAIKCISNQILCAAFSIRNQILRIRGETKVMEILVAYILKERLNHLHFGSFLFMIIKHPCEIQFLKHTYVFVYSPPCFRVIQENRRNLFLLFRFSGNCWPNRTLI